MVQTSYLTNQFLIAMPNMDDPNFARGVTLVCQHNSQGAMGICINQMSDLTVHNILAQMKLSTELEAIANNPVFIGGPIQQDRGFVVHELGKEWESSYKISKELAVTTSRDILAAMASGKGPDRTLVALGYAGWAAGQLEHEMRENIWLTVPADARLLFHTPIEQRWEAATKLVGIDPHQLSDYVGHA